MLVFDDNSVNHLLLFGDSKFTDDVKASILKSTVELFLSSGRLDKLLIVFIESSTLSERFIYYYFHIIFVIFY